MKKLSVIIPIYNAASYLKSCIESIITQSGDDWELILVDDGSTDTSLSIAQSYLADSRVKVFTQQNSGPSVARNKGIDAATGEYISFVDADDWVDSDYIKILLSHAGGADIIFWGLKKVFEGNTTMAIPAKNYADSPQSVEEALQLLIVNPEKVPYFGFTVTKLFKKAIIDKYNLRFNSDLRIKEDELFIWRYCCFVRSLRVLDCAPYNYRILQQSLSHSRKTYANYSLLAKETIDATDWIKTDVLKAVACKMIFDYLTGAVLEAICLNKQLDAMAMVEDYLAPYIYKYRKSLVLPIWGKIALGLPTNWLKNKFILNYLAHYSKQWKK